ncbi:MAG: ornithine cyclodeaminase [Gammaproteobacteria bacterium]|nr:ornithine cyclodeaminase [Gammaproteobacteria bacterium]
MKLIRIQDIQTLFSQIDMKVFFRELVQIMKEDFSHWAEFQKSARYAAYVENGVMELMPICSNSLFSFKYVNGHPENPSKNLLNIVALGMLANVETGHPLMISEMTLLTALRTAAVSAMTSQLMARKNSKKLAIIGCGAQSEFQVLAHHALFDLSEVHYFDLDPHAMDRFAQHLKGESFQLIQALDTRDAIRDVDIIITSTAARNQQQVLKLDWIQPGQHISGIGGDSPGKTELDIAILKTATVVIEYFPQTVHEGEIQNLGDDAQKYVHAELWELCAGTKPTRRSDEEITLFDAVGFAIEDYSILRYVYQLTNQLNIGLDTDLIPEHITDPKNLFGLLKKIS